MEFKIGDKVKWTSQSQGYEKTKEGIIVLVLKPGESIMKSIGVEKLIKDYNRQFDDTPKTEIRYAVAVYPKNRKAKPTLYRPQVKKLTLCK